MATPAKLKRGPSVLVTDARDAPPNRQQRPPMASNRNSARLISVDNVLQYASEIPSGQRRGPQIRPAHHNRTPSGRHPLDPKLSGRTATQHMPSRSSKISEKLVLLPDADDVDEEKGDFGEDEEGPPRDGEEERLRKQPSSMKQKSYAERLPKASRTEKLSRVTAYCTSQAYKMRATTDFVRTKHGAKTKLYDDCLYTVYHLPLLPGNEGYRIRSSPVLKSPGGKAVLDEEIERNERHEYREGFFGEEQYGVPNQPGQSPIDTNNTDSDTTYNQPATAQADQSPDNNPILQPSITRRSSSPGTTAHLASSITTFAEMFVLQYGVVVFWNFTERQEKDILADLTFSSTSPNLHQLTTGSKLAPLRRSKKAAEAQSIQQATPAPGVPLTIRPLDEADFETEEFHFEYNPEIPRPRVFNDMITLRSADHMIKLSMSHAIAQSTKLSFFEERMAETMAEAQHVPRRLALRGELGMKREEVVRMVGRLFKSRVDVNLSSNMLDVPNFFWDSEPTLHPLYAAVREYLEIKPRIQVLNERCKVFLDLAEILSDSINDRKMSRLTWIIIILIVLSILVTCSEVFLRFGILSAGRSNAQASVQAHLSRFLGNTGQGVNASSARFRVGEIVSETRLGVSEL